MLDISLLKRSLLGQAPLRGALCKGFRVHRNRWTYHEGEVAFIITGSHLPSNLFLEFRGLYKTRTVSGLRLSGFVLDRWEKRYVDHWNLHGEDCYVSFPVYKLHVYQETPVAHESNPVPDWVFEYVRREWLARQA